MRGGEAFNKLLETYDFATVLDVGCGMAEATCGFLAAGKHVTAVDHNLNDSARRNIQASDPTKFQIVEEDYMLCFPRGASLDVVWCSHVLEHQLNPGLFLQKLIDDTADDGLLAITVPPAKPEIVNGHVSLWNAGILLYQLVAAGLDCGGAAVATNGYDISVIVEKVRRASKPHERLGDLKDFFPPGIEWKGATFHGEIERLNW